MMLDSSYYPGSNSGIVLTLISDMSMATKLVKAAKRCHLKIHNFDRAEALMRFAEKNKPVLIIADWITREAEAFNLLQGLSQNGVLNGIPVIGYVSNVKLAVGNEAEKAGCQRVYMKTEFLKKLEDIFVRYGV